MNEHAEKYAAALAAFNKAHWKFEKAVAGSEVEWPDVCAVFEASQDALKKSKKVHRSHGKTAGGVGGARMRKGVWGEAAN